MRSRMSIENPGAVKVTLTLTMPAKEWEELRDQLQAKRPSSQLSLAITDLLSKVRKIVWHEPE